MINSFRPVDVLYSSQWHFGQIGQLGYWTSANTLGIERVWLDYTGAGVSVGIWDDGVQLTHWDLATGFDASRLVSVNGQINTGLPVTSDDGHGTAVAGLIAAQSNGQGGVGVAFGARYTPVRIFGGPDDINSNWSRYLSTLDGLGQFDVTNHSYGGFPDFSINSDIAKFAAACATGRGGLGTVHVKSAGNDNIDGNGDALDASRHTLTVAALDATGNAAWYSTYGAHILVSASAGSVTTDILGSSTGYDGLLSGDYTNRFGGTSAAGPITAGVVALMLDANAGLGWRDVHNILAYSATGTGSLYGGQNTNENNPWKWTGAGNWNGGGLHYSEDYGYGMVNAFNAVRMAEIWSVLYPLAATSANELSVTTGTLTVRRSIADLQTLSYAFDVNDNVELEHVALQLSLTHTDFTDLRISLRSPQGTLMSLYDGSAGSGWTADDGLTYTFGLDGLRGERAAGKWTLEIQDAVRRDSGTLQTLKFTGYGKAVSSDDVYHYTDEAMVLLSQGGQSERVLLQDTDGGLDWINAAAMSRDLVLDLRSGASSSAGGVRFLRLDSLALIEHAAGGDGNDSVRGNGLDNTLYGMRGNDTLYGGAGTDTAGFLGLQADYEVSSADGVTTVVHRSSGAVDVLYDFEWLKFDDGQLADPSTGGTPTPEPPLEPEPPAPLPLRGTGGRDVLQGTSGDDLLMGLAGNDTLDGGAGNDLLDGGADNDTMRGGAGDDVYMVDSSRDRVIELAAQGVDTVRTGLGSYTLGEYLENLEYLGTTAFAGNGNSLDNRIEGGVGNDRLSGAAGSDYLDGGQGNDLLNGGAGSDWLTGGEGVDIFRFDGRLSTGGTAADNVTDFAPGIDKIHLENAVFGALRRTGQLSASSFVAADGAMARDRDDFVLYDTANGSLYYDADGAGRISAILFGTLMGAPVVSASDFIIV